jgi:hypothetical protein
MEFVKTMLNNVNRVQQQLPSILTGVLQRNNEVIIDANVDQLKHGLTSKGELITPEYESEEYAAFKQGLGSKAPAGTPDLILEGDFTGAFYTEPKADGIMIDSHDDKTPHLEEKYDDIFGLIDENKREVMRHNADELIIIIENEITRGL